MFFFFQAEDGIRDTSVTGVQTCALPICIVPHYLSKRSPYLLWWSLGVLTFGLGTLTESINAIFGWSEWNTKIWYIVGALLGGYPLAQGTIHLLMKKRFADISAAVCSAIILVAAVCVLLSPIEIPEGFDH